MYSTLNSGTFKYTGFRCKDKYGIKYKRGGQIPFYQYGIKDTSQQPVLSDGKETLNPKCGHSILYKCYSDSDKCILCDLKLLDNDLNG